MGNNVCGLSRYATRSRRSTVIRASDDDLAGDDLAFGQKLAMDNPDLSAELEVLQQEIRRDRRSSLMMLSARRLVPLTVIGLLLVLLVAGSSAY